MLHIDNFFGCKPLSQIGRIDPNLIHIDPNIYHQLQHNSLLFSLGSIIHGSMLNIDFEYLFDVMYNYILIGQME